MSSAVDIREPGSDPARLKEGVGTPGTVASGMSPEGRR